jgi:hypothetical protein
MYVWSWQQKAFAVLVSPVEMPAALQEPLLEAEEPLTHVVSPASSVLQYPAAGGVTSTEHATVGFIM